MKPLFLEYPPCGTCKKAKKWLDDHAISFEARHIRENRPSEAELRQWHASSGLPLKRFFNTSGQLYKTLQLKDKLASMSDDEQFALLASDGMLVKRPILVHENGVLVGFRETKWEEALL